MLNDFLVTTAYVAGRIFGLSPEIPGTLKNIGIDGMEVEPSEVELEAMHDGGVISPYFDADLGYFCLSQAVNSLQQNLRLINDDATTFSIQCKRILHKLLRIWLRLIFGEVKELIKLLIEVLFLKLM